MAGQSQLGSIAGRYLRKVHQPPGWQMKGPPQLGRPFEFFGGGSVRPRGQQAAWPLKGCLKGWPLLLFRHLSPGSLSTLDHLLSVVSITGKMAQICNQSTALRRLRQLGHDQPEWDQRNQGQRDLHPQICHGQRHPERGERTDAQKW